MSVLDSVYPVKRQENWYAIKHTVKQDEASTGEEKRRAKVKPVDRVEKWHDCMNVTCEQTTTTFDRCKQCQCLYLSSLNSKTKKGHTCPCHLIRKEIIDE